MTIKDELTVQIEQELLQALSHLDFSYKKIVQHRFTIDMMDVELLETWEAFLARFSRVVDIYLSCWLRKKVTQGDPGFRGTLRDFVN